jgi:uncharacterized metal-binding protein
VIAVDACEERCATALVEGKGVDATEIIWLPEVSAKHRLSIRDEDRKGLSDRGMALARALADEVIERVDALTGRERAT